MMVDMSAVQGNAKVTALKDVTGEVMHIFVLKGAYPVFFVQ